MMGFAALAGTTPAVRADGPPPTHIAVVNLREAYSKLAETKDVQAHLSKMQDDFNAMQTSHKAQLDDFTHQVSNLKPGSPQHGEMMDKMDDMQLDFKRQEALQQVKMQRIANHHIIDAYREIQAAVADIAKKRGFDLVIVNNDTELPDNAGDISNQETVVNLVFGRNVLYASDKISITADVVTAVDAARAAAPAAAK
jgi:Skp family chaperone for outer membrane proteins